MLRKVMNYFTVLCLTIPPLGVSAQFDAFNYKGCGVNSQTQTTLRITGGRPAEPRDWPWMAALLLKSPKNLPFCGGTLISHQHVLTAAHCLERHAAPELRIRLGEVDFNATDETVFEDFEVISIIKHEKYDLANFENDIAIVKLKKPASFTDFISSACLPPPNRSFDDETGFVTGWGSLNFGGNPSTILHEVLIKVWKQNECVNAFPHSMVTDNMMCCGWTNGDADSCQGDSGGPFVVQVLPTKRWHIAGIVSWGQLCAAPNSPGVYTRVNKYLDWIRVNTQLDAASSVPNRPNPDPGNSKPEQINAEENGRPFDCSEVCINRQNCFSGVYTIYPFGEKGFDVFCDMATQGGGWTVLLNRDKSKSSQENFQRLVRDYNKGFGNPAGEYWIGNEILHKMTNARNYTLHIDAKSETYDDAFAEFPSFKLLSASNNYKLILESPSTGSLLYNGRGGLSLRGSENSGGSTCPGGECFFEFHSTGFDGVIYPGGGNSGDQWNRDNPLTNYIDSLQLKMRRRRDL